MNCLTSLINWITQNFPLWNLLQYNTKLQSIWEEVSRLRKINQQRIDRGTYHRQIETLCSITYWTWKLYLFGECVGKGINAVFRRYLQCYNNKDVVATLKAMLKMVTSYHNEVFDMLKLVCTLPISPTFVCTNLLVQSLNPSHRATDTICRKSLMT